ncbi:MAG: 6-bladed beta-propeller [Bacteroidales bacterium]|nr:6-bladed beta-propeller [Bacteroidales bacterium]
MGKIIIIIYFFIILFIFSYCEKKKTTDALSFVEIGANVKNIRKIYLSQFSDNVRYVPLENSLDHPLSWTWNILSDFSEKYILDSDGGICLLYDNKGHLVRQIGKRGRGPGEYTGIKSVAFMNENIYIHDYFSDDLIEYKMDGTLVKRYKSGFTTDEGYHMEDAILINDSMIFGNIENRTGQVEYKALMIDKKGDVKYYYKNYILFELEPGVDHAKAPGDAVLYRFGNKIFFKELLNDTLFKMDYQYQLIPAYVFDFGKYKQPLSERGKDWSQIDFSSYIKLQYAYQTDNFLILVCDFAKYFPAKRLTPEIIKLPGSKDYTQWYNTSAVLGIYDKQTGNLVFSETTSTDNHLFTSGFYNDIDAGPKFMPVKMVNDSTMVMKIRFEQLIEHIASDDFKNNTPKYPERKKRLEELVDSLMKAEFDNPLYMMVTFNSK